MRLLASFVLLFIIGFVVIVCVVYLFLFPRTHRAYDSTPQHPFCRWCTNPRRRVHGCRHYQGVPSTWVHDDNGSTVCNDGEHTAQHR
jgi:hypothetical protein